jgi:hypothetical protein
MDWLRLCLRCSAGHSLIFDHMKSEHRARASAFMTEASLMHDAEFEQSFRVSRVLFRRIADAISSDETVSKSKFPVDLQLSVLLQSYAHGMSVGACSTLFGISKQTVCNIRRNVNHAILTQLGDQLSWYASKNEQETAAAKFEELCGLPGIVAAVDGSLIPIFNCAEMDEHYLFQSRKHFPAIVLQVCTNVVICKYFMCCTDVYAGCLRR